MNIMDVKLLTFAKLVGPTEIDHMECIRIPDCLAGIIKHRLGAPYESTPTVSRWSAMFVIPSPLPSIAPYPLAFEMVCCTRGSSLRCHWQDAHALMEIAERMVPELIVEVIAEPIKIAA